jgi:hypothetical protein
LTTIIFDKTKSMKRIFQGAAVLFIILLFVSCSKKNESASSKPVTAKDLLGYYIAETYTSKSVQSLSVTYFVDNGDGSVNAVWDRFGARRSVVVTVKDNQFSMDLDGNGSVVFSFTLKRDSSGGVALASSGVVFSSDANSKIDNVEIFRVSDAPGFTGQQFSYSIPNADDDTYLYFDANGKWHYEDYNGSAGNYSYYNIGGGNGVGWKCEDAASGGVSMGVMVPKWNGQEVVMLTQSSISRLEKNVVHMAVH